MRAALLAGTILAFAGSLPAMAQQSIPAEATTAPDGAAPAVETAPDDIVVTGIRRSLADATRTKRDLPVIADGISAEDIGKFPDQNLAESLQRITGVQITRSRGEGSSVNIRGLSSEFSRVQYNGRTVGTGGSRSFDFQTLSAEFVAGVEVYKSPTADMLEGGLAGTVNVRSARPLDIGKSTVSVSVEGVHEQNSNRLTPRGAILANYVTNDDTFGLTLGAGYEKRRYLQVSGLGYGVETAGEASKRLDYNLDGDQNDTFTFDHAYTARAVEGFRERLTLIGGFQAKPADWFEAYGDVLYAEFRDDGTRYEDQLRFTNINGARTGDPFGIRGSTITTDLNASLPANSQGFVTVMDADGVDQRVDAITERYKNTVGSGSVGFKLGNGPAKLNVMGSYTTSALVENLFGYGILARASAKISRPDGLSGMPRPEYTRGYTPAFGNFNYVSSSVRENRASDENLDARADLTYEFADSPISAIKVGGYVGKRQIVRTEYQASFSPADVSAVSGGRLPFLPDVEGSQGAINAAQFLTTKDFGGKIQYLTTPMVVADTSKFFSFAPLDGLLGRVPLTLQRGAGFDIIEKSKAVYLAADYSHGALSGNVGVRYVDTNVISSGFAPDLESVIVEPGGVFSSIGDAAPATFRSDYAYFLPSTNVKLNVSDRFALRIAVARVLGRPGLGQLAAGTSVNANVLSISSGNPALKPYLSDQADVSAEFYLPGGGILSAAAFYKRLSNFVISGQQLESHTVTFRGGGRETRTFRRTSPENSGTVRLKGIELGAQVPFTFLPAPMDGFGVGGSFTYIDAPKVVTTEGEMATPLEGVSKIAYTGSAYFEKSGFGIRASYTWRDAYTGGQPNYFGDNVTTRAYGQLDGSISYDITQQLSLNADVSNALNANAVVDNGFGLLRQRDNFGRRITAGARFKF